MVAAVCNWHIASGFGDASPDEDSRLNTSSQTADRAGTTYDGPVRAPFGGRNMERPVCAQWWLPHAIGILQADLEHGRRAFAGGPHAPSRGTAGREPISCLLNLHKAFRFDMHRCAPERNARIWRVFRSPRLPIQAWPGQFAAFEAFGGGRRDARQFDALRFRRGHGERHAVIVVPSVSPSIICPQDWLACRTKSVGCAGDAKTILKNWKRHWFAGCVRGTRGKNRAACISNHPVGCARETRSFGKVWRAPCGSTGCAQGTRE